jgi:two-component system phosphate regulon sensor histidine kinase PhoR
VRDPSGEVLFSSQSRYASTFAGSDTLGAELGSLVVETAIRPDAAEYLIIGGLPASRLPLLATLLVLTLALGVAALLQVRRQQQLTRLREDFVSGVSHEFRTPLTQIRLFAELLRDGKLDADAPRERALSVINREASRLTHLVENVLRFSALRRGSADDVRREDVEIRGVVDDVLEAFAPLASERGARVEASIESPCHVQASRGALHQILTNLLDNALKYGPDGQTVRVAARSENGAVRLSVEDEGPGVPRSERSRIWEPYRRLRKDVAGDVRGTGIGLAVVAELTSALGGRAWVEGRDGPGSRFVVELSPSGGA